MNPKTGLIIGLVIIALVALASATHRPSDPDLRDVAAAKEALAQVALLNPSPKSDASVVAMAQTIVDATVPGVTVNLAVSSNSQVSPAGTITYGSTPITGDVTFTLTKNAVTDTQTLPVSVPAAAVAAAAAAPAVTDPAASPATTPGSAMAGMNTPAAAQPNVNAPVSKPKVSSGALSVRDYGARGDGYTDDTAAIQSAINAAYAAGGGTVFIPEGQYMIDPLVSVRPKNNVKLSLAANATLKAKAVSDSYYNVINITNVSNVSVVGGRIVGERYSHTGSWGEWGTGINIEGSNGVYVANVVISDCWGDGVFVGDTWRQNYSANVIIEGVTARNNRRNGFSIISAKNLTIRNCIAAKSNGTAPQSGMDIEPNEPTQFLQNILIENFHTEYNNAYGLEIWLGTWEGSPNPLSITIKNYSDTGSKLGGMHKDNFNDYINWRHWNIKIL